MECVTINLQLSPHCVTVLQSWHSSRRTTATMTSCCGRCKARSGDQAGGFWEGLQASPAEMDSAVICWTPGSTLMWPDSGFSGFILFGLFKKTNSYWKETVRTVVYSACIFWNNQLFYVFFFFLRESHDGKSFFPFFGNVVYEVREKESIKERRHWKQNLLKRPSQYRPCAVIWSVLTELSRGMEKIIRRNVWGALKWRGPRDWPMGEKPAVRQANFFLMNSTACFTMQSDCQSWTHIWFVFGGSKWQDQFCLQRKGGVKVGRFPCFWFH